MTQHYHIFLSYSRADTDIMQRVYKSLADADISVWIDRSGIPIGTPSWKTAIEEGIDNADCLVVLFSPTAKKSRWVKAELEYAENQGKPIFPVLVAGDEASSLPFGFATTQLVDVRDSYDEPIGMLIQHLQEMLMIGVGEDSPVSDTFEREENNDYSYVYSDDTDVDDKKITNWITIVGIVLYVLFANIAIASDTVYFYSLSGVFASIFCFAIIIYGIWRT